MEEQKAEKLEKYIFREQEYNRVIDDIKNEIQKATTYNFEERKEKTQDELHVQEIKRQISQNAGEKVELNDIDSNFVSSNDHRNKNTNGDE